LVLTALTLQQTASDEVPQWGCQTWDTNPTEADCHQTQDQVDLVFADPGQPDKLMPDSHIYNSTTNTELFATNVGVNDSTLNECDDVLPMTLAMVTTFQWHDCHQPLTLLFDSGNNTIWINLLVLPAGETPTLIP
jgi:hypothetical protein